MFQHAPLLVQTEGSEQHCCRHAVQVLVKGDARLDEVISQYIQDSSADLMVLGSHNLCAAGECSAHNTCR